MFIDKDKDEFLGAIEIGVKIETRSLKSDTEGTDIMYNEFGEPVYVSTGEDSIAPLMDILGSIGLGGVSDTVDKSGVEDAGEDNILSNETEDDDIADESTNNDYEDKLMNEEDEYLETDGGDDEFSIMDEEDDEEEFSIMDSEDDDDEEEDFFFDEDDDEDEDEQEEDEEDFDFGDDEEVEEDNIYDNDEDYFFVDEEDDVEEDEELFIEDGMEEEDLSDDLFSEDNEGYHKVEDTEVEEEVKNEDHSSIRGIERQKLGGIKGGSLTSSIKTNETEAHSTEETNLNHEAKIEEKFEENGSKDEKNSKGVVYHLGMTLVEFLRENPTIRKEEEVLQYFDKVSIKEEVRNGRIFIKRGKIII